MSHAPQSAVSICSTPLALLRGLLMCTAGNQVLDDLKRRLPASVTLDLVPLSAYSPQLCVHLLLRPYFVRRRPFELWTNGC